jgi:hypothetical protein
MSPAARIIRQDFASAQAAALAHVAATRTARDDAQAVAGDAEDKYRDAIREALAAKVPAQAIADAAGLTRRRVYQIHHNER